MRRIMAKKVGGGYDPDFQAWIDFNIIQGNYLPDASRLSAANDQVVRDKASGFWDKCDLYLIRAWNDPNVLDAKLVCIKSLKQGTINGGVISTLEGLKGDGVNGYVNNNFFLVDDSVNYTEVDGEIGSIVYVDGKGAVYNHNPLFSAMPEFDVCLQNLNTSVHRMNGVNNLIPATDMRGTGFMSIRQGEDSGETILTKKNTVYTTRQNKLVTGNQYLVSFVRRGSYYGNSGESFFFAGGGMTDTMIQQFRSDFNTYLVDIGLTPYA